MEDGRIFEEVLRLKKARQRAVLVTIVECTGSAPRKVGAKMVVRKDGSLFGSIGGGPMEHRAIQVAGEVLGTGKPGTLDFTLDEENGAVCGGRVLLYLEPVGVPPRLLIVGDGHVAQATARLGAQAGFLAATASLGETSGLDSAGNACRRLGEDLERHLGEVDGDTYVVIATRDHLEDFSAVAEALRTPARFIGLLGSRRKRVALEEYLRQAGLEETALQRVTTPVGLEIGAETPEEIAVSIMAQIIRNRREHAREKIGHTLGGRAVPADGVRQAASPAG